ncbi:MAG: 2-C-methyl-D-erythritol 4-phosphate cytidylyltransferase [Flavobacteriales bacterium]
MSHRPNEYIIIVAGGKGLRMQSNLPKQFMVIHDKPILVHTMERFRAYNPEINIVLAMNPEYIGYWEDLIRTFGFDIPHNIIPGGAERFHSVKNGLESIEASQAIVGVHDAVRPLVSIETISICYQVAREHGNAVPVIQPADTLRVVSEAGSTTVDRNVYRIVQTPQCFDITILRKAYLQEYKPSFTDDASVVEATGEHIHLVQGNRENIKITDQEDVHMASYLLRN